MRIAIIGSNGQLGSEIYEQVSDGNTVTGLTHEQIEICDIDSVNRTMKSIKPDIVINTAAYHKVPDCEKNPEMAFKVNAKGVLNLVLCANDLNYTLVHFSTDYVFDGRKKVPYIESDTPNPLNIYAITKLDGETIIRNYCEKYFIIRVSGLYGKVPCRAKGGNFIHTMIKAAKERDKVKVVDDEILSPTSVYEIAHNLPLILGTQAYGIYHMVCAGEGSWYDFAKVIFEKLKLKTPLESCSSSEFPSTVKRPMYSVLENHNLQSMNMDKFLFWQEALINFLADNYR